MYIGISCGIIIVIKWYNVKKQIFDYIVHCGIVIKCHIVIIKLQMITYYSIYLAKYYYY